MAVDLARVRTVAFREIGQASPERMAEWLTWVDQTFDFEVVPSAPGELRFWITTGTNVLLVELPIRVR